MNHTGSEGARNYLVVADNAQTRLVWAAEKDAFSTSRASRRTSASSRFAGLSRGQMVDLSDLIKAKSTRKEPPRSPGSETGFRTILMPSDLPTKPQGVELLAPPAVAAGAAGATAGGMAATAGALDVAPVIPTPRAGKTGAAGALDIASDVVEGAAEVVEAGACLLSDASCPGDCAAIDLSGIDCGSVDCGGVDCSF